MLGLWMLWVALAAVRHGHLDPAGGHYLLMPAVLLLGVLLGRRGGGGITVVASAGALGTILLVLDPIYANAQAACGVQMVALAGLLLVQDADEERVSRSRTVVAVVTGALGLLLAAGAQAASVLALVVAAAVALAVTAAPARPVVARPVVLVVGLASIGTALLAVLVLAALPTWPEALSSPESLSGARHDLWRDAGELWRRHPIAGGGPGSFLEASGTARSAPHLYAAHSSILQVASELGTVGALLLAGLLAAGALAAHRAGSSRGLIGVTAWCALAVHSMIDHLYEFPAVVLLAGAVIGSAGVAGRGRAPAEGRGVPAPSPHDPL
ncbi:O-antigen ligase family protein [Brachybacterium sp. YJGR34]|uniref:O-antigen ligase family protein n=1 Tax=Brachybacterium sp. YJGR34 TaxID=2059911 RepID=UPI001300B013|nr:O-antigen ligase family protein [Brachybacterium sp. YJGR34]